MTVSGEAGAEAELNVAAEDAAGKERRACEAAAEMMCGVVAAMHVRRRFVSLMRSGSVLFQSID